jgi:hypothetical protein
MLRECVIIMAEAILNQRHYGPRGAKAIFEDRF